MANVIKGSNAKQPTAIGSLQFQTSQRGGVVPLVYGTTRVAGNLVQYDDFSAQNTYSSGKKGGIIGGGDMMTGYYYSASFIIALCQGPIDTVGLVWQDQQQGSLDNASLTSLVDATLHQGTDGQPIDAFWAANHPGTAQHYSGTAYVSSPNAILGTSAEMPNFSMEVEGFGANSAGPTGVDCNPAFIVKDFLTNPRYGCGFPVGNIDNVSLNQFDTYCKALTLGLSPQLDQQVEAQQALSDIAKSCNTAIVWSGGLLKMIPYGDIAVGSAAQWLITISGGDLPESGPMPSVQVTISDPTVSESPQTVIYTGFPLETLGDFAGGLVNLLVSITPFFNIIIQDFNVEQIINDTDPDSITTGSLATIYLIQQPASIGPTSITITTPGFTLSATITENPNRAAPVTYTPDVTPVYSLTDDDFITQASMVGLSGDILITGGDALRSGGGANSGGGLVIDDPVQITRSNPADALNWFDVEIRDRFNSYNTEVVSSWDQAAIDLYGIRKGTSSKASGICEYTVGTVVAEIMKMRSVNYRNTYRFKLGWRYCLLEPMDIVEITDVRLGLNAATVRITSVVEDQEGTLTVTAEDFFPGYSTPVLYQKQIGAGYNPVYNSYAGYVNPPAIFEAPPGLAADQIWIALSGVSTNWGGAEVWVSYDGTTYAQIGTVSNPSVMGYTTADLPADGSVDVTDTLAVDLTESRGTLISVNSGSASAFASLVWVADDFGGPGEFMSYQDAALTAQYMYNLTTLFRNAYGSPNVDHASGSQFVFTTNVPSPTIFKFSYDPALVGQTIYFKFVSFNIVGGGTQTLDSVPAYPYVINGGVTVAYPFTIESFFGTGLPSASEIANVFGSPFLLSFNPNFGSIAGGTAQARASVAATGSTVFSVQKALAATPNTWTVIGTVTYGTGDVTGTFATTGGAAQSLAVGDSLRIVAPSSPDATLAGVSITLVASR